MQGDPRSGSKVWKALDREIGKPEENSGQIFAHRSFNLRQLSTIERIAATLGPACGLPMCIQFLRPRATGRMEFSAKPWMRSVSARTNVTYMASRLSGAGRVRHKEGTLVQGWAIST